MSGSHGTDVGSSSAADSAFFLISGPGWHVFSDKARSNLRAALREKQIPYGEYVSGEGTDFDLTTLDTKWKEFTGNAAVDAKRITVAAAFHGASLPKNKKVNGEIGQHRVNTLVYATPHFFSQSTDGVLSVTTSANASEKCKAKVGSILASCYAGKLEDTVHRFELPILCVVNSDNHLPTPKNDDDHLEDLMLNEIAARVRAGAADCFDLDSIHDFYLQEMASRGTDLVPTIYSKASTAPPHCADVLSAKIGEGNMSDAEEQRIHHTFDSRYTEAGVSEVLRGMKNTTDQSTIGQKHYAKAVQFARSLYSTLGSSTEGR